MCCVLRMAYVYTFSSVQSLSCVQVFATPWIAARQASLSITNSQSLPKLMSIELVYTHTHTHSHTYMSVCLSPALVFLGSSVVKNLSASAGDMGLIPGLERSPGEGSGEPVQDSYLGNPMDKGAWWTTVHGVTKSRTRLRLNNMSPASLQKL